MPPNLNLTDEQLQAIAEARKDHDNWDQTLEWFRINYSQTIVTDKRQLQRKFNAKMKKREDKGKGVTKKKKKRTVRDEVMKDWAAENVAGLVDDEDDEDDEDDGDVKDGGDVGNRKAEMLKIVEMLNEDEDGGEFKDVGDVGKAAHTETTTNTTGEDAGGGHENERAKNKNKTPPPPPDDDKAGDGTRTN